MRFPRSLAAMILCFAAGTTSAVEWDHDANLAGAVTELVGAYHAGGLPQAEKIAAACQGGLADIADDIQRLMRFEYCTGMDLAGYLINRRDMQEKAALSSAYFEIEQLRPRMDRLSEFVPNPVTHTQILHSWGRKVADELDRQLK